jgi:hypothetical protein
MDRQMTEVSKNGRRSDMQGGEVREDGRKGEGWPDAANANTNEGWRTCVRAGYRQPEAMAWLAG